MRLRARGPLIFIIIFELFFYALFKSIGLAFKLIWLIVRLGCNLFLLILTSLDDLASSHDRP